MIYRHLSAKEIGQGQSFTNQKQPARFSAKLKTGRNPARGISAEVLYYSHLPTKIPKEINGSEPDLTLEKPRAAVLHND
jgi:hypothetical protein